MIKLLGYIIILLLILGVGSFIYFTKIDFPMPDGYNFCRDKGYDSVSVYGSYSEKFGKVNCVSCYDLECDFEEFNVTKKFGIIKEIKE